MQRHHQMFVEAENADELLFVCPEVECGRRIVIKREGGFVVIEQGDFFAQHSGGSGGAEISAISVNQ